MRAKLKLAEIAKSATIIPNQLEFVDIAGLVRGASKGEGLGNKFLAHIREVDAVMYVLRCLCDDDITHVEGSVDPLRDAEIIELELAIADLESLEKRVENNAKKAKAATRKHRRWWRWPSQFWPCCARANPRGFINLPTARKPSAYAAYSC
jgi:ribosome-binding ATPase YchF (GTP1/OBG family)